MSLTKEELAELSELESEDKKRKAALEEAAQRQHLEALRMSKRLAAKHGEPGRAFVVLETTVGNFAVRAPKDVEIDTFKDSDSRDETEKFAMAVLIEPTGADAQPLFADHPALASVISLRSVELCKVERAAEVKK
jgi:hypothetical protein